MEWFHFAKANGGQGYDGHIQPVQDSHALYNDKAYRTDRDYPCDGPQGDSKSLNMGRRIRSEILPPMLHRKILYYTSHIVMALGKHIG
jgi:hypothetical protein